MTYEGAFEGKTILGPFGLFWASEHLFGSLDIPVFLMSRNRVF